MFGLFKHFEFSDIPDLTGKVAVITGASTGIGKICVLEMARKNCHVVFACRSKGKTLAVMEEIKKETGNNQLEYMAVDLMSLESVTSFIKEFKGKHGRLHILFNNAGLMGPAIHTSEDGLDSQFVTSHLAHYYLTTQLLPIIKQSGPSRIVNVSSAVHRFRSAAFDFEHIYDKENHGKVANYGKIKAANILFTIELNKRLAAQYVNNVYVNCNHPGTVQTDLSRDMGGVTRFLWNNVLAISVEKGALTQLFLATSPEVEEKNIKAKYCVPYGKIEKPSPDASLEKNALDLWNLSEKILKEKVPGYQGAGI